MNRFLRRALALIPLCSFSQAALADVRLPALFGDGMVLQRDQPLPVWGWADAGEEVTVSFRDQSQTATAGADGIRIESSVGFHRRIKRIEFTRNRSSDGSLNSISGCMDGVGVDIAADFARNVGFRGQCERLGAEGGFQAFV